MNAFASFQCLLLALALCAVAVGASAAPPQLVSVRAAGITAAAGGDGDSMAPLMSEDGRFILFASSADNLVQLNGTNQMRAGFPAPLNVYLYDRSSAVLSLVSINLAGTGGGNGDSLPSALSQDGRFILFESSASNLVEDDFNDAQDVFLRDLATGKTVAISVTSDRETGDGDSGQSVMTPDARFIAFESDASDLVAGDTNGIGDVFVRDLSTSTTMLVSVGASSWAGALAVSESPRISDDGRYIAFNSTATNLVLDVAANILFYDRREVYLRDLVNRTTTWASGGALSIIGPIFQTTNLASFGQLVSSDAHYVVYAARPYIPYSGTDPPTTGAILRYDMASGLTELVCTNASWVKVSPQFRNMDMTADANRIAYVADLSTSWTNMVTSIQLWDAASGALTLVSGDPSGVVPPTSLCDGPVIDASGRFVAFYSDAPGLVTNTVNAEFNLYLHDLQTTHTVLVAMDANGAGCRVDPVNPPQLSDGGQFVAFGAPDGALVSSDANLGYDVFLRDVQESRTLLLSAHAPALARVTANGSSTLLGNCSSADGRYVVFASAASDLVLNDTNSAYIDLFIRDLTSAQTTLVTVAANGGGANGSSSEQSITPDGRFVVFTSSADNLVGNDTNRADDVFVRDLQTGTTTLVSVNNWGIGPGGGTSSAPSISDDGRYVVFYSWAKDLTLLPLPPFSPPAIFVRDLQTRMTYVLVVGGSSVNRSAAALTPDGRFAVFSKTGVWPLLQLTNFVWETATASVIYSNANLTGQASSVAVNRDVSLAAYAVSGSPSNCWFLVNRLQDTTRFLDVAPGTLSVPGRAAKAKFSDDSRYLVYVTSTASPLTQVALLDLQTDTKLLVSQAYDGSGPGNDSSDSPDISSDGRFVVYRSAASNLVPDDTNDAPDIFLYDAQTGITTLISSSLFGGPANNRSSLPSFSRDGSMLFFESWASDLVTGDFNWNADIFARTVSSPQLTPKFRAELTPGLTPATGAWLNWPATQGWSYRVQYKDGLDEPWRDLQGNGTIIGDKACFRDPAPAPKQRFYRIVAY